MRCCLQIELPRQTIHGVTMTSVYISYWRHVGGVYMHRLINR